MSAPFAVASGVSYLIQGRQNWPGGTITLSNDAEDNAANGITRIIGAAAGDVFGLAAGSLPDRDGDGFDEFVVTSRAGNGGVGAAYLFAGRDNLPAVLTTGSQGVTTIPSPDPGVIANFGGSVSAGPDFTGDGVGDMAISHILSQSVLFFSGSDASFVGRVSYAHTTFGTPLFLKDFDGNGRADLIAATHDEGAGFMPLILHDGVQFLNPSPVFEGPAKYGRSIAPADDLTGQDGLADFVIGSPGTDEILIYY